MLSPPRGHWAKRAAGKTVKQTALPRHPDGTITSATITPASPSIEPTKPALDPVLAEQVRIASADAQAVRVPAKLRKPHPRIAAWIASHQRDTEIAQRDRQRWGHAHVPAPFTSIERRQQRILNTVLQEAEKLGYKVVGDAQHRSLAIRAGSNTIEFTLRERIKQIRRPLTDEGKSSPFYSNQNWRQERVPSGKLIFDFKTHFGAGLTTQWQDAEEKIEHKIGEIVAVLAVAGPLLERRRQGGTSGARYADGWMRP